jgi:hypothetical protein
MISKEGIFTGCEGEYKYYSLIEQHSEQQRLDEEERGEQDAAL